MKTPRLEDEPSNQAYLGTVQLPAIGESLPSTFARFRTVGPMVPLELPGGVRAWAATTHAAVRAVLDGEGKVFGKHSSHWAALRDGRVPADWPFLPLVLGEHLLHQDGDAHLRLRRLMSTGFTPARVLALRPRIEQIVDDLLDRVIADAADGKDIDLVPAFAEKLPIAVISELFGVPETERDKIRG